MPYPFKLNEDMDVIYDDEGYETEYLIQWDDDNRIYGTIYLHDSPLVKIRRWHNNVAPYECLDNGTLYDDLVYLATKAERREQLKHKIKLDEEYADACDEDKRAHAEKMAEYLNDYLDGCLEAEHFYQLMKTDLDYFAAAMIDGQDAEKRLAEMRKELKQ